MVPDRDKFIAEKAEFAYAIVEQALKGLTVCTSRHTAVVDKALRSLYNDFFALRDEKLAGDVLKGQMERSKTEKIPIQEIAKEIGKATKR